MTGFVQVIRKDWGANRLFWAATLAAHALYIFAVVRRPWLKDDASLELGLAELIPLAVAVASLIQADGPANRLGDWRTRPVERGPLLLAKLATISAFLIAPRFLIGMAGGALFNLSLPQAAAGSVLHLAVDLITLAIYVAMAAATRGMGQMVLAGGVFSVAALVAEVAFGPRLSFYDYAPGVAFLASVCAALTVSLYWGGAAFSRAAIVIACMAWLPITAATALVLAATVPAAQSETPLTRRVSIAPAIYRGEPHPAEDFDYQSGRYLPYRMLAPGGLAIRVQKGVITPQGGAPLQLPFYFSGDGPFSPSGREIDFEPSRLRLAGVPSSLATMQAAGFRATFDYRGFVPATVVPLPTDQGFHRLGSVACSYFGDDIRCVSPVFETCLATRRRQDSETFDVMEVCPPDGWRRWLRWPLPYAFADFENSVDNVQGISFWREEGRFERSFVLSQADLRRRLVDPASLDQAATNGKAGGS